jgi:hypothetical protein
MVKIPNIKSQNFAGFHLILMFLPFWNQVTKQIIMGELSRQFNQVRLIPWDN